jgi:hypothetical protein
MSDDATVFNELQKMNTKLYPNRIEVCFEKEGSLCAFVYREFFDYVPLDIANELNRLNLRANKFFFGQSIRGLTFNRLEKGIEIKGKSEPERAIIWLMSEGLLFAFHNQAEINARLDSLRKPIIADDSLKIREWNPEIDKIVRTRLAILKQNLAKKGINLDRAN